MAVNKIEIALKEALKKAMVKCNFVEDYEIDQITIEIPKEKSHGDYSTNIAMQLTRLLRKNPRMIAEQLIEAIDKEEANIDSIEIAGPGFINMFMKKDALTSIIKEVLAEKDDYKNITPRFYSLEYQEKMIYIDILQLIFSTVMITIVVIWIISAIILLFSCLFERREEFRILSRIGATNGNINKILIYECLYMFIKALVISVIISIPIIYAIIKHMEKVIIVKKLLIPFGNIGIFVVLLFIISLAITLYSSRFVKNK